ncbi:phosphomannomutase [Vibrio fluvialis]|nr:phosphomannomutase [Vibrio fluvialis]
MLNSKQIIEQSGVQFGTSGARGLVSQFLPEVSAAFTHAFLNSLRGKFIFEQVAVAIDNRPSSPAIAQACAAAIVAQGYDVVYCGVIPTPALAYAAMQDDIPCIMVTGSHIPFDRNGLKFYRPDGEISKSDEQAILGAQAQFEMPSMLPELVVDESAGLKYIERYTCLFPKDFLKGKRIGVYEHSSAGRDLYSKLFSAFGAHVVPLERTDTFVPIDTEAVSELDQQKALIWSEKYDLDVIFSTDGDGDRPLVSDDDGNWLRGDILGALCAKALGIEALAIPVSCNSSIECLKNFKKVSRTRIGSPYVLSEMIELANNYDRVSGFEANGGFMLGSDIEVNGKLIKALPTRDAVLPFIMLLCEAKKSSLEISDLVSNLPKRYTHSDRLQNFPREVSGVIISEGKKDPDKFILSLGFNSKVENIDETDGFRLYLKSGDIIHIRASGNAPELRCYAESETASNAKYIVNQVLRALRVSVE